jgi:hypothetical protein
MAGYTKGAGFLTNGTEKDMSDLVTETATWAIIQMAKLMAKGFMFGTTKRHTMESGAMASKTVTEFGPDARETLTSDSGSKTKRMDTESTSGQTETNTRENGTNALDTAKAPTNLLMVTASPGSTPMAKWTAMASIVGLMETSTAAFSEMT